MPKKKSCIDTLPLPKWRNKQAGLAFLYYTLGVILQTNALYLPYWIVIELVEPDVEHVLWVFGYEEGFYQDEGLCIFIKFCIFWAFAISLVCILMAFKAAKFPKKSDKKVQMNTAILGFFGWLFGILSMAMFSPGEKGDVAKPQSGFYCQMIGLTAMLAGVLVQFEAGNPDNLSAQDRNKLFGPKDTSIMPTTSNQPDPPKEPPKSTLSVVPGDSVPPPPSENDKLLEKNA